MTPECHPLFFAPRATTLDRVKAHPNYRESLSYVPKIMQCICCTRRTAAVARAPESRQRGSAPAQPPGDPTTTSRLPTSVVENLVYLTQRSTVPSNLRLGNFGCRDGSLARYSYSHTSTAAISLSRIYRRRAMVLTSAARLSSQAPPRSRDASWVDLSWICSASTARRATSRPWFNTPEEMSSRTSGSRESPFIHHHFHHFPTPPPHHFHASPQSMHPSRRGHWLYHMSK